jgi:Asp-tRNA(Asn)/Glu-tRNA(Gln) amidotransferase A subunit family amidase
LFKEHAGLLAGKLVTFKDNLCTEAVKTTCGSKMLADYQSPFNATVVNRMLKTGVVSLGKTNMDEFGMGSVRYYYQMDLPFFTLKKSLFVQNIFSIFTNY